MAADVEDQAHEAYMIHWSEELRAMDAAYNEDEAKAKILLDEQKRKVEAEVGKLRSEIAPMTPLYERLVQLQDEVKAYKLRDMDTTFNESRMARSAAHRKARIAHHDKLRDYIRNVTPRESQPAQRSSHQIVHGEHQPSSATPPGANLETQGSVAITETAHNGSEFPPTAPATRQSSVMAEDVEGELEAPRSEKARGKRPAPVESPDPASSPKRPRSSVLGSRLTDKTVTYDEIYADGRGRFKHYMHELKKEDPGHWYVTKCDEHGVHFGDNLAGPAKHLNSKVHGKMTKNHLLAVQTLGYLVLNCTRDLAEQNNMMFEKAKANGYRPLNARRNVRDKDADRASQIFAYSKHVSSIDEGQLYWVTYNRESYVAMVLGWGDLVTCGLKGTLASLNMFYTDGEKFVPDCFEFDEETETIRGWAPGYRNGEANEKNRTYPVMYFEPDGVEHLGWAEAKDFRSDFKLQEKPPAGLEAPSERAKNWYARVRGFHSYTDMRRRKGTRPTVRRYLDSPFAPLNGSHVQDGTEMQAQEELKGVQEGVEVADVDMDGDVLDEDSEEDSEYEDREEDEEEEEGEMDLDSSSDVRTYIAGPSSSTRRTTSTKRSDLFSLANMTPPPARRASSSESSSIRAAREQSAKATEQTRQRISASRESSLTMEAYQTTTQPVSAQLANAMSEDSAKLDLRFPKRPVQAQVAPEVETQPDITPQLSTVSSSTPTQGVDMPAHGSSNPTAKQAGSTRAVPTPFAMLDASYEIPHHLVKEGEPGPHIRPSGKPMQPFATMEVHPITIRETAQAAINQALPTTEKALSSIAEKAADTQEMTTGNAASVGSPGTGTTGLGTPRIITHGFADRWQARRSTNSPALSLNGHEHSTRSPTADGSKHMYEKNDFIILAGYQDAHAQWSRGTDEDDPWLILKIDQERGIATPFMEQTEKPAPKQVMPIPIAVTLEPKALFQVTEEIDTKAKMTALVLHTLRPSQVEVQQRLVFKYVQGMTGKMAGDGVHRRRFLRWVLDLNPRCKIKTAEEVEEEEPEGQERAEEQ